MTQIVLDKLVVCGANVGTAAAWAATTKTIESGVIAIESDTGKMKIGDNSTYALTPYFYDPTAHVTISAKTAGNPLAIVSPNVSTGASDTDGFLRVRTASGNDGYSHRWTATSGDYQITRTVSGTTTTAMSILKSNGAVLLGSSIPNETARFLNNSSYINSFRFIGSVADGSPIQMTTFSSTNGAAANIPLRVAVSGTSDFAVTSLNTGRSMFKVTSNASAANGLLVNPGISGSPVTLVSSTSAGDTNVGMQFVTTGDGSFSFGSGYPSLKPMLQAWPGPSSNVFLSLYNPGSELYLTAYPSDNATPTKMILGAYGSTGGVQINGKFGVNVNPTGPSTISGTFTDLNSLKDIVYQMGNALHNNGLWNFSAT